MTLLLPLPDTWNPGLIESEQILIHDYKPNNSIFFWMIDNAYHNKILFELL